MLLKTAATSLVASDVAVLATNNKAIGPSVVRASLMDASQERTTIAMSSQDFARTQGLQGSKNRSKRSKVVSICTLLGRVHKVPFRPLLAWNSFFSRNRLDGKESRPSHKV